MKRSDDDWLLELVVGYFVGRAIYRSLVRREVRKRVAPAIDEVRALLGVPQGSQALPAPAPALERDPNNVN